MTNPLFQKYGDEVWSEAWYNDFWDMVSKCHKEGLDPAWMLNMSQEDFRFRVSMAMLSGYTGPREWTDLEDQKLMRIYCDHHFEKELGLIREGWLDVVVLHLPHRTKRAARMRQLEIMKTPRKSCLDSNQNSFSNY